MDFENKVAIVTGSQRGIGEAIALKLAQLGAKVAVTDISQEGCQEVVEKITSAGGEAVAFKMDISNKQEVEAAVTQIKEKYGKVDILINNAGICHTEKTEDSSQKTIDINLKGTIYCSKAVLPLMLEQKYGKIVNIASIAALVSWPLLHSYSASKGGIISLTTCMAGEFAGQGININAIAPGAIQTPMLDSANKEMGTDPDQIVQGIPKARIGTPEDIANAAAFLSSDEADYIVGQILIVDGGYTVR